MKATVSAAFFTLLAVFECSAQHSYYYARQYPPAWPVNGQQNNQLLGGQYQQPSFNQNNPPRQNAGYPQVGQIQANQNQAWQPQDSRPSGDSELTADRIATKNTPMASWATPDNRAESSSKMPTTQRTRWSKLPSTSVQEAMGSGGQVWNTPPSSLAQAVEAHRKTSTTPRTLQASRAPSPSRRKVTNSTAPPPKSEDRIVYLPPGANAPDTTHNSLESFIPDEPETALDINHGLRQFALDMLMDMTMAAPSKNVVISPYSIWAVMLVIYEGAEGRTATQIAKTLRFNDSKNSVRRNYRRLEMALRKANEESHSDFVSGNGIFYDDKRPLLPDFERFATTSYQCQLLPVDFAQPLGAVKTINDWVASVTRSRIKMLVKADDIKKPELIITNALFFKGQWKIPFNLSATHTDKFYDEQKRHIADVRMMYQKGPYMYSFITEIGAHVLDMPYQDDKFRMLVVLPKPSSTVAEVLRSMKQFPVDQCYERLLREQEMFSEDEVHVFLPRFKFGNRVELRPNLERLGITDVFNNMANLSSMSSIHLALGKVFHVSEIDVNEEGTVASAATAGGFVNKMGPPKFLANRPFAYFIVEHSQKTVIFAGKVTDPTKKWN